MSLGTASLEIQVRTEDVRRASQQLRKLSDEGRATDATQARLERQMRMLSDTVAKASKELARMRDIQRATGGGTKEFNNEILKTARILRQAEGAMGSVGRQLKKLASDAGEAARGMSNSAVSVQKLHGVLGSIRGLIASFSIGLLARSMVELGNEFTRVRQTLLAVTGSTSEATKEFNYLMALSFKLGSSFLALADSYAQFRTAAEGTTLQGEKLKNVFEAIAETATVMRFSTENTRGVIKAFEQMLSKGSVQAEELRNQLGDRLPGAFGIFVRAHFGVKQATQEQRKAFNDLMKQGAIVAEDILPKVAAELRRTFGAGLAAASQSAQAELNRMETSWQKLVMVMWDSGLEDAVKNVALTLRSLFESESTIALAKILGKGLADLTKIIYDLRGVLVPAIAAMTVFVGVFAAGSALRGLAVLTGGMKTAVGVTSALSAAVVGLAAAFGMMGSAKDKAGSTTAPVNVQTASVNEANPLSGAVQAGFDPVLIARQIGGIVTQSETVRNIWSGISEAAKSFGSAISAINWSGAAMAGIGAVSTFAVARPQFGKVQGKFNDMRSQGMGKVQSMMGTLGQGVQDRFGPMYAANLDKTNQSLNRFMVATNNASAASQRMLSGPWASSITMSGRMTAAFGQVAGATGRAAASLARYTPLVAGARTVMSGLYSAMGGLPGIILGVTAAIAFLFLDLKKRKEEALRIDADSQALITYLSERSKGTGAGVSQENKSAIEEGAKTYSDLNKQAQEFEENSKNMMKEITEQTKAYGNELRNTGRDIDLLATTAGQFGKEWERALSPDVVRRIKEAAATDDYKVLRDTLVSAKDEINGSSVATQNWAREMLNTANEAVGVNDRIDENQRLLGVLPGQIADVSAGYREAKNEVAGMNDQLAQAVGLTASMRSQLADVRKDALETIALQGQTGTAGTLRKLDLYSQGLNPDNAAAWMTQGANGQWGMNPLYQANKPTASEQQEIASTRAAVMQADAMAKAAAEARKAASGSGSRGAAGRARAAESRQNRTQSDFAAAQQKIYGLLDPVRAERVAMDEEVRELTRALTRGGMASAEATALVAKYRQLREEETAAASRAAKRNVDRDYNQALGINGRDTQIAALESELDSFRVSAMRAGIPLEEIDRRINGMREAGIQKINRAVKDMTESLQAARASLTGLQSSLASLQGLDGESLAAVRNEYASGVTDVQNRMKDASNTYLEDLNSGGNVVATTMNFVQTLSTLAREENVLAAIRDRKIRQMEYEGRTTESLARRQREILRNSQSSQLLMARADAVGAGRDGAFAASALRNPETLRTMFPDGDPDVLRQIPGLMDSYGSLATDKVTTWRDKVQGIYDALQQARQAAVATRGTADLTNDEINRAGEAGVLQGQNNALVVRNQETIDAITEAWRSGGEQLSSILEGVFAGDKALNSMKDFAFAMSDMISKLIWEFIRLQVIKPWIDGILGSMRNGLSGGGSGGGGGFWSNVANIGSKVVGMFSGRGAVGAAAHGKVVTANGFARFAHGGVVPFARAANDNVSRFAQGGVVNSPRYFAMGNGRTGLMGESGEEAIMPLKRTKSGDLGVQVSSGRGGSGGVTVHNDIHISVEGSGNASEDIALGAKRARETIEGISAETYMKMEGQKAMQPVSI